MAYKRPENNFSQSTVAPNSANSCFLEVPRAKKESYRVEDDINLFPTNYEKELGKIKRRQHHRTMSHVSKLDKIIQDASDLNEILSDPNTWLSKNRSRLQE